MNWKTFRVPILIAAVCAGLITLLFIGIPSRHKLVLKAYFADGIDLRAAPRCASLALTLDTLRQCGFVLS